MSPQEVIAWIALVISWIAIVVGGLGSLITVMLFGFGVHHRFKALGTLGLYAVLAIATSVGAILFLIAYPIKDNAFVFTIVSLGWAAAATMLCYISKRLYDALDEVTPMRVPSRVKVR